MPTRALLAILAMVAGFVLSGPGPSHAAGAVAVSATVEAAHLTGTATRPTPGHPVQRGDVGQPLDGVQPPVHVTPPAPLRADVVDPTHDDPERIGQAPLGERAPPLDLR